MRRIVFALCAFCFAGCPAEMPPPAPTVDTESPKDSPVAYKVLRDETVNNSVEYHVLVAEGTKHDDAQKLLEYLYRRVSTRRDDQPAAAAAHVYTTEAAYATPPRTPVASVLRKSGELGPTFENKVPLEFWQEVEQAVWPETAEKKPRRDAGWKLGMKVERNDAAKTLVLTVPYTEPGLDKWAEALSFNQALQTFTDAAQALFEKVGDLKAFTFVGLWNEKEVVRITLARADYTALRLRDIDERIGQHHGSTFLKLATGKQNDKQAAKENSNLIAKEYRAMLAQLKGRATVDAKLK